MKVNNKKDIFEKEGQLFNHIKAMYVNSKGYEHYWQNRRKDRIVRQLKELKGECSSVLDIGCAEGLFVEIAENLGYFTIGCDIARSKLTRANVKVIECDAQNLPFKDNVFDIVIRGRILEYIPNDEKALFEASRVARKWLIITVPNNSPSLIAKFSGTLWRRKKGEGKKGIMLIYDWGTKGRVYNLGELTKRIQKQGYICNLTAIAPFGYIMPRFTRKIPICVHEQLDNLFEGRPFLKEYGQDIFALVKVKESDSHGN